MKLNQTTKELRLGLFLQMEQDNLNSNIASPFIFSKTINGVLRRECFK